MPYKIVIVEDDTDILQIITEYLKNNGYIVLTSCNGKNALDIIEQNEDIALFIFDIMLPEVSGLELLKAVRRESDTPIIMLTAINEEYTQLNSFDYKADDYITKPFSPKILVKRVQALLRRTGKANEVLQVGNVSINVECFEAFEDGNKIILTLKELEILKYLIQNKKKVLSRQQILNYVWDYEYFGDERIVDVHIKNLRKKFKSNIITTVKGVGYKIDCL